MNTIARALDSDQETGARSAFKARRIADAAGQLRADELEPVPRLDADRERAAREAALASYVALTAYMAEVGVTRWGETVGAWADVLGIRGAWSSRREATLRRLRRLEAFGLVKLGSSSGGAWTAPIVELIDTPSRHPATQGFDTPPPPGFVNAGQSGPAAAHLTRGASSGCRAAAAARNSPRARPGTPRDGRRSASFEELPDRARHRRESSRCPGASSSGRASRSRTQAVCRLQPGRGSAGKSWGTHVSGSWARN